MDTSKAPNTSKLVEEACGSVVADIERKACLDEHCSDQMMMFMALAFGHSAFRTGPLTEHAKTAIHFAQACTGAKFEVVHVSGAKTDLCEVRCEGICWQSPSAQSW